MACLPALSAANPAGAGKVATFNTLNKVVLERLPREVRSRLPAVVTEKAALRVEVMDLLQRDVVSGKSFQDMADALRELHRQHYYRRMLDYYSWQLRQSSPAGGQRSIAAMFGPRTEVQPYPPLEGVGGYKVGMGRQYLADVYLIAHKSSRRQYQACCMAGLGGRVLAADHTFKVVKNVTSADGSRSFEAVFDVMNEFGQVVALLFTGSKSMEEIEGALCQLNAAWEAAGAPVSARLHAGRAAHAGPGHLLTLILYRCCLFTAAGICVGG